MARKRAGLRETLKARYAVAQGFVVGVKSVVVLAAAGLKVCVAKLVDRFPLFWPTICWEGRGTGIGRGVPGFGRVLVPGRGIACAGPMRAAEAPTRIKAEARKVFMSRKLR